MPHLLTPKFNLVNYETFVKKLADTASGQTSCWKKMKLHFNRGFSGKMEKSTKRKTYPTETALRAYTQTIPELSREDIEQQIRLYLVELWTYMVRRWSSYNQTEFYTHMLVRISNWIGRWMAIKIQSYWRGLKENPVEGVYEIDNPDLQVEMNLGWTMLKEKYGLFKGLNVKQKYFLYMRYEKDLTNGQIAESINQCIDKVNKEWMVINRILKENKNED